MTAGMGHHACATSDDQGESIDALLAGVHAGAAVCMAHHLQTHPGTNQSPAGIAGSAQRRQLPGAAPPWDAGGQTMSYPTWPKLHIPLLCAPHEQPGGQWCGCQGQRAAETRSGAGTTTFTGFLEVQAQCRQPSPPPLTHPIPTYTPAIAQHVDTCATCSSPATKQAVTIMCLLLAATSPLLACWLLMS